jgi:hypothetical protein
MVRLSAGQSMSVPGTVVQTASPPSADFGRVRFRARIQTEVECLVSGDALGAAHDPQRPLGASALASASGRWRSLGHIELGSTGDVSCESAQATSPTYSAS